MAWLVPLFLSLLLTHTPLLLWQRTEPLALELDGLLWWSDDGRLNFLFDLTDWMELLVCPSVPLESVLRGALLRVAVVGAGISTLKGTQHQSHFYADLKKNRQIIHFLEKREMPRYWQGQIKGIQYNTIPWNWSILNNYYGVREPSRTKNSPNF